MKLRNALSTLTVVGISFCVLIAFGIPTFGQEAQLQKEASAPTPAPAMNEVVQGNIEDWVHQERGVPNDWSHHHVIFSNPGTEQDAIANGTHDRWLRIVNDPRYIIQQLKRRAAQGPAAADAASIEGTAQAGNAASAWRVVDPTPAARRKKSKLKKDWSENLGSGTAAALTCLVGTLNSSTISSSSTLTVDGVTFDASAPATATGSITVASAYCIPPSAGVTINSVNIATNATAPTGGSINVTSDSGLAGMSVGIGGVTYTYESSLSNTGCGSSLNCLIEGGTGGGHEVSAEALYRAINNTGGCTDNGWGGAACYKLVTGQGTNIWATAAHTAGSTTTTIPTWKCGGTVASLWTCTGCGSETVVAPTGGGAGSAGTGTFALPNPISNTALASNMAGAIGTETSTDFVTAASGGTNTVTLTGQNPGTTDNVTLALDGAPTGLTLSGMTGGANGVTSGTSSPPTFAYWSGATYATPSAVATNIVTAIQANTTLQTVSTGVTSTANSPSAGDVTITARTGGTGGNSYSVAEAGFSAFTFTGTGSLSGGTTATVQPNMYPAVYGASLTAASCSDFAVYPTGQAGSSTAANIIAYDNLYATGSGPLCVGGPSVYWAYNTGAYAVTTSPIVSPDGTQIAFIESNGTTASLVLIKWAAKAGESVTAPLTLANSGSGALYRSCTPTASTPCMFTIAFGNGKDDTFSAPFYDFASDDALYVGDNDGYLHQFTGVFVGTPAETTTNWPVPVNIGAKVSSPVYDSTSGKVFVGDSTAVLYAVGTGNSTTTSGTIYGTSHSLGDTIIDGTLIDSTAGTVYAFVTSNKNSDNAVFQFPAGFSGTGTSYGNGSEPGTQTGTGGANYYFYSGTFDNVYYSSTTPPSGNLYVVGGTGSTGGAVLYRIPILAVANFTSTGNLNSSTSVTITGTAVTASAIGMQITDTTNATCIPANDTIASVSGSTVMLATAAGCTSTGDALTISNTGAPASAVTGLTTSLAHPWPSPLTEFCNGACTVSGGVTSGNDYVFFSVNNAAVGGCTAGAGHGCILSYNVSNPGFVGISGTGLTVTTPGTNGCWATSGIEIDNSAAVTTGASQIYFVNLNGAAAGGGAGGGTPTSSNCTAGAGPTIDATQASQASP